MAKSLPIWIGSQIRDDRRSSLGNNQTAGPGQVTHRDAILQSLAVALRQPGRGSQPKVFSISIQKQDRNHQAFSSLFFEGIDDKLKNLGQWSALRDHFKRYLLTLGKRLRLSALVDILDHADRPQGPTHRVANHGRRNQSPHDRAVLSDVPLLNRIFAGFAAQERLHAGVIGLPVFRVCNVPKRQCQQLIGGIT